MLKKLAVRILLLLLILFITSVVLSHTINKSLLDLLLYWYTESVYEEIAAKESADVIHFKQAEYYSKKERYADKLEDLIESKYELYDPVGVIVEFVNVGKDDYEVKVHYKTKPEVYFIVTKDSISKFKNVKTASKWKK